MKNTVVRLYEELFAADLNAGGEFLRGRFHNLGAERIKSLTEIILQKR